MPARRLSPLWDSHVHLQSYPEPHSVVASAKTRGIRMISTTVSQEEAAPNLKLRSQEPSSVRCFIGVHPSEAESTPIGLEMLDKLWKEADGVGEVGLDPKYSAVTPGSAQVKLFEAQLDVAERLGKPVQVHTRDAEEACLDLLDRRSLGPVLLHWFEGEELVEKVLRREERYVSFGPAIIYSKKLSRMASRFPPERVLTESDGPVPFAPLGGAEGPGLIASVVFKLAELWKMGLDEASARLSANTEAYLG